MSFSQDRVESLIEAFRPGRERERDKAQLLSPTRQTEPSVKVEVSSAGPGGGYLHQVPGGPGPIITSEPSSLSA